MRRASRVAGDLAAKINPTALASWLGARDGAVGSGCPHAHDVARRERSHGFGWHAGSPPARLMRVQLPGRHLRQQRAQSMPRVLPEPVFGHFDE